MLSKFTSSSGALRTIVRNGARRHMGLLSAAPTQNGLNEIYAGTPALVPHEIAAPTTEHATSNNGISIVSEQSNSPLATISVVVGVGSRDTTVGSAGAANLLKHIALTTTDTRSTLRIARELENIGATVDTTLSRETLVINAASQAQHFTTLIEVIGDAVSNPAHKDWEVREQLPYVQADVADNGPGFAMNDAIHAAAYYDSLTLGVPLYGSLSGATPANALALAQSAFVGSNMTVVATGATHDQITQGVNDRFSGVSEGNHSRIASEYVGGEARVARGSGVTDVCLALNVAGQSAAAVNVLVSILGSASLSLRHQIGERSSGRVGAVLENNDAIGGISGFADIYTDGGLVGLVASTNASNVESTYAALAATLKAGSITDAEVAHAKAVLGGYIRNAGDSQTDRAAQHVSAAGAGHVTAADLAAVTTADVEGVLAAALKSAPSFGTVGDLTETPRYNVLSRLL